MNDNPTDFKSQDIRNKNLDFNVQEKKFDKFKGKFGSKLKLVKQSLQNFPLFKGKNKFITLGAVVVIVAVAITLPMFLSGSFSPAGQPGQSDPKTEEERTAWVSETSGIVNNLSSDTDADTRNATLQLLDEQITAAATDADKHFLIGAKANALNRFGQHLDAVAALKSITADLESQSNWPQLIDTYGYISSSYEQSGDKASALEYLNKVLEVYDKALDDPNIPFPLANRDYWESMIETMKGEL